MFQKICVIFLLGAIANIAQADNEFAEECQTAVTTLLPQASDFIINFHQVFTSLIKSFLAEPQMGEMMEEAQKVWLKYSEIEMESAEFTRRFFLASAETARNALAEMDHDQVRDSLNRFFDDMRPLKEEAKEIIKSMSNQV